MCCMRLAENTEWKKVAFCAPSHNFATKACIDNRKNWLNSSIFFTHSHNMVYFGPVTAEIGWWVWGTPASFNRFCVLASLLHWNRSTGVNQMLHGVWPSPALHNCIYTLYIHFWGLLPRNGILPGAKFTLHPSLVFSYIANVTAWHSSSGHQPNVAAYYKEWNYGTLAEGASGATYIFAGRPSRWALAHLLVPVAWHKLPIIVWPECFDNVGWVTGRHLAHEKSVPLTKVSVPGQVEEKSLGSQSAVVYLENDQ